MSEVAIRFLRAADGEPGPFDGQWLVEYDPTHHSTDPYGRPVTGHIVCSRDPALAKRFPSVVEAHALWNAPSGRIRADGRPDRPLSAFHVVIEPPPSSTGD